MKSLTIKDLARTTELDRQAMAGVTGGMKKDYKYAMPSYGDYSLDSSSHSFSFDAEQAIGQKQETCVNNGNNVALACDITANVDPTQKAKNTINFGGYPA